MKELQLSNYVHQFCTDCRHIQVIYCFRLMTGDCAQHYDMI